MLVKGNYSAFFAFKGNILLIQLGDIGDVILSTPCVTALKQNYPDKQVLVAVREKAYDLMLECPGADKVIAVAKSDANPNAKLSGSIKYQIDFFTHLKQQNIGVAIDLRTGTRGAWLALLSFARLRIGRYAHLENSWRNHLFTHLVRPMREPWQYAAEHNLNILEPLQLRVASKAPRLNVSEKRYQKALSILGQAKVPPDKPMMAMVPFSLWRYKEWQAQHWFDLIEYVQQNYPFSIIVTGGPEERERAQVFADKYPQTVFNLAGKTAIGDLPAVIAQCKLLVGVDTAAIHVAAAVDCPTITLFGPSSKMSWAPRGDIHHAVSMDCKCLPCTRKGCNDSGKSRCLDDLAFDTFKDLIDRKLEIHIQPSYIST